MNTEPPAYDKPRRSPPYAALLIGAGLIILGVVAGLLLTGNPDSITQTVPPAQNDAPSVVPVAVHYAAPELTLTTLDGSEISLADYQGQVILVNNWATWCPPCKAEMPTLQAYYEAHQSQGFILIAIDAADPKDQVEQFVHDYGLTFPIWLDPQNKALLAFQNQSLPSSYVIDRQGMIRFAWTGAVSRAMLEKYVTPLMEE